MNAVVSVIGGPARSVVEERAMRPPTIGRIRPGIKALTKAARANPDVVALYEQMVAAGEPFDRIGTVIESQFRVKNALTPRNVDYFTCRRSDFTNPEVADEILRLYGEDRGHGLRLYRFPVLFAFNDWLGNLPNQMTVWGTSGRKFFSEYGGDGIRYCKTYGRVEHDVRAKRATRHFGGRHVVLRNDNAIPDGVCNPEQCPQYQARQCNLSAHFMFAIPDIKGLGLIELPTNSIYVLQKAYSAMQTVQLARGRLTGTRFWLSKREFNITRINEAGEPVRQMQMLTVLDAEIDIGALLDGADDGVPALESARGAVSLLEGGGTVVSLHPDPEPAAVTKTATETATATATDDASGQTSSGPPAEHAPSISTSTSKASPGPLMQRLTADEGDRGDPLEPLEEKLHRMSDLLRRLGLSANERQRDFQIFAYVQVGRGWTKRPADVDRMIARLAQALDDPAKLETEIAQSKASRF